MKRSIAWHEECLKNSRIYHCGKLAELQAVIIRTEAEIMKTREGMKEDELYGEAIENAKAKKVDGFDIVALRRRWGEKKVRKTGE